MAPSNFRQDSRPSFRRKLTALAVAAALALAGGAWLYGTLRTPDAPLPEPSRHAPWAQQGAGATQLAWRARVALVAGDGTSGVTDGAAAQTRFADPYGVAIDKQGHIYVADGGDGNRIRLIAPDGAASTLAGGKEGYADGQGAQAAFHTPSGIAIDDAGNLYVADTGNHAIRKVTPQGLVSTLAGNGMAGSADGQGAAAQFNGPVGIAVSGDGVVYVADTYNDRIRRIAPDGTVTTLAGTGKPGDADGAALKAQFDTPCALALAPDGALFIADSYNDAIRKLGTDGVVTTVAVARDNDRDALLRRPMALAVTHDGYLYVATGRGRIVQQTPDGTMVALPDADALVEPGYGSDGNVHLFKPRGMALARDGSLFVSDAATYRLHRIAAAHGAAAAAPAPLAPPAPPAPPARMLWPVAPQDAPHEVVGVMGEVRGNYDGESRDHFHSGLDIQADVGSPVLAVQRAKISDPVPNWGFGGVSEGISVDTLAYIHMRVGRNAKNAVLDSRFTVLKGANGKAERVRVQRGARFEVGDTLGTINSMAHVHLDYYPRGTTVNPLTLPFIGLRDTVAPQIAHITLFDASGRMLRAAKRKPLTVPHGTEELAIVVDAYDQMDGNAERRRLGLYKLGYQLLGADGKPVAGYERPVITQVYDRLPRNRDAVKMAYAASSGITVYGSKATRFAYALNNRMQDGQVVPGTWHVGALAPGDYILRIVAEDFAGNAATEGRDLPFTLL